MEAVAVCGPASIVPLSAVTVIVSTWLLPTGFVSVAGAILMFASLAATQCLVAGPEFEPVPSVVRVIVSPPTDNVAAAVTVVVPLEPETRLIWHEPVPSVTVHGFGVVKVPGPLTLSKEICVPLGAFWKP